MKGRRTHRVNSHRSRKAPKKGGGSWDEYCPCCGRPFSVGGEVELENADWIEENLGFDEAGQALVPCGAYDGYGSVSIVGQPGTKFEVTNIGISLNMGTGNPRGVVIHRACAQIYEGLIGRPLIPTDGAIILQLAMTPDFFNNDQYFMWDDAVAEAGEAAFDSPANPGSLARQHVQQSLTPVLRTALDANAPAGAAVGNAAVLPPYGNAAALNTVDIPPVGENMANSNALMGNLAENNVLGFFPDNAGRIYDTQGITAYRKTEPTVPTPLWRGTLASGQNPFTRQAFTGQPVYRRAHLLEPERTATATVTVTPTVVPKFSMWKRLLGKKSRRTDRSTSRGASRRRATRKATRRTR